MTPDVPALEPESAGIREGGAVELRPPHPAITTAAATRPASWGRR
jgi:hypothetical protein